jgi:hypothetical protein
MRESSLPLYALRRKNDRSRFFQNNGAGSHIAKNQGSPWKTLIFSGFHTNDLPSPMAVAMFARIEKTNLKIKNRNDHE